MSNNENRRQEVLIRTAVVEKLKSLLTEILSQTHPSTAALRFNLSEDISSATLAPIRNLINARIANTIRSKLTEWCRDEYDYIDYTEEDRKYAIAQVGRLMNMLDPRH